MTLIGDAESESTSTAMPRRSHVASPTQLKRSYQTLLMAKFQNVFKGEHGEHDLMSAIAASLFIAGEEVDTEELYADTIAEVFRDSSYYSTKFRVEVTSLANSLDVQLQALADNRGVIVELYDVDDYRGGKQFPTPKIFDPHEIGPVCNVCILKDGDEYFALEPFPMEDPIDSPVSSPITTDEETQPGSVEKIKRMMWPFSAEKKNSATVEADAPTPAVSTSTIMTPERKRPTKTGFSKSKQNFADAFGDETSTAQTVQTSGAKQKLDFSTGKVSKSESKQPKKKKQPTRRSARNK